LKLNKTLIIYNSNESAPEAVESFCQNRKYFNDRN